MADAKVKAETLAHSLGKNIGDAITVTEDVLVSNSAYGGLRSTMPAVFGSGAVPAVIGELEYYACIGQLPSSVSCGLELLPRGNCS